MSSGPRRAAIACTYCRQRKRKCDGGTPRCRTCRVKGLNCVYSEIQREDDQHGASQLHRLEAIESLLREHSEAIESLAQHRNATAAVPSPVTEHGGSRADSGRSRSIANNAFPFTYWAYRNPAIGDTEETPPLTIPLGHQTSTSNLLTLPQLRCIIGEYPCEFNFQVEDSRPRSLAARSGIRSTSHLEEDLSITKSDADEYLEKFFELVHPLHPFLEVHDVVTQYEGKMSKGLASDNQSALLLAIFSLGATAADSIDNTREGHSGDVLVQKALRILYSSWTLCFTGNTVVAQGLVLCALYFTYTVEPLMAWRLIHMASTTIQQILARSKDMMTSDIEITRLSWACFIIESDILAEFHQPRSGIELLVDRMPFPDYGVSPSAKHLGTLAEISARSLLNRIHHTLFYTDSLSIYAGRNLSNISASNPPSLNLDASLLRVCGELNRQLESWYESLPESIKPGLAGDPNGTRQTRLLRLRYWSAKQIIYRPFVIYVTSQNSDHDTNIPQSVLEMCELCLSACRMFILTAGLLLSYRTPYTYSSAQCCFSCILVLSMAARDAHLQHFVEDIEALQQRTIELLQPWTEPKTSIACALEITSSIATKQKFRG